MYETILLPLDGSRRAERALFHAERLAATGRARIVLLRVVEQLAAAPAVGDGGAERYLDELRRRVTEAEAYLEQVRARIAGQGIEVAVRLAYGDVLEAIGAAARELDAELVVITSHGCGGDPRVFYGATAAGYLQRVDRPLLVIRARRVEGPAR